MSVKSLIVRNLCGAHMLRLVSGKISVALCSHDDSLLFAPSGLVSHDVFRQHLLGWQVCRRLTYSMPGNATEAESEALSRLINVNAYPPSCTMLILNRDKEENDSLVIVKHQPTQYAVH
jgi:hypothetical protein